MNATKKSWILLVLLAVIWGSSFILMKRGMYTMTGEPIFSDAQVGALRMFFAGLVLLPFAVKGLRQLKSKKDLLFLFIVGFFGNFLPAFLFTYAETYLSSGYAGMLNSCTPIFTGLIGFVIFKVHLSRIQIFGLGVGTIGMVLLMLAGKDASNTGGIVPVLAIVLATLMYGTSLNTIKHKLGAYKAVHITSMALMLVFIPALYANWHFDTVEVIQNNPNAQMALVYIAILGIIGTALAVIVFNRIIALKDALFASTVTYFIPIVAVFIGFFFQEDLTLEQIASMFVVLFGVFMANYWHAKQSAKKLAEN
ncbi:MAG: DMT family transporter [Crocinitomicaceae bacterium]|nr:DMT family transporter [Crocinitomicaceae bacterium]